MSSLFEIESNYEYILGQVTGNVLNFEAMFRSGEWTRDELEKIKDELVEAGQTFATAQGLGNSRLYENIRAELTNQGTVDFTNNAMDDYGRYYAGHVEYGHRTKSGGFVPARPFMRPAMYAVSEASRGRIAGSLSRWLEAMWSPNSMWAGGPLSFGHSQSSKNYTRAFYSESQYMNKNAGKGNTLPHQSPSRIRQGNQAYSVHRDGSTAYSKSVMSNFGWK